MYYAPRMAVFAHRPLSVTGWWLVAAVSLALSGCALERSPRSVSGADAASPEDAGETDAGSMDDDAGFDAGLDAGSDAGVDAGLDAGRDAGPQDAGIDAGGDACVPTREICDGIDNDCNPETPDGADDPGIRPCESEEDSDLCSDDYWTCVDGTMVCPDQGAVIIELCGNDVDDDCDMSVDEATGGSDALTYYNDIDGDGRTGGMGLLSCDPIMGYSTTLNDCDETRDTVHEGAAERCGIEDDDCDGMIDEGGVCPCRRSSAGDRVYLYCDATSWSNAVSRCLGYGGYLVTVSNDAETAHLLMNISTEHWIGLNDRDSEDDFVWVGTDESVINGWDSRQPDDYFGEDCTELRTNGRWNDLDCGDDRPFICEIPPQPQTI